MTPIKAETPEQKRELAEYLKKHDQETLAFLQTSREAFGMAQSVHYGPSKRFSGAFSVAPIPTCRVERLRQYGRRSVYWMECEINFND